MSRVVVHVGPWKTASTDVQRGLFANTELLAEHGVYLPRAGRLELEPRLVCHHHLAWQLSDSPRFRRESGGWEELADELAGVSADVVLLSSEEFGRGVHEKGIGDELDRRLRSLGRDITIVYVVRDQLSQINSAYAQKVKLLKGVDTFAPYAAALLKRREADLERATSRWYRPTEFDFVAVPYATLAAAGPTAAIVEAARIDLGDSRLATVDGVVNISLGPVAVEAFRLLRAYLHGFNRGISYHDIAVRRLHRMASKRARDVGWCDDEFWGWTPELAARAADQLARSNERFARAVWGTSWPDPLPVDRPQAKTNLLTLPDDQLASVQGFVTDMATRYVTLRRGGSA